MRAIPFTVTEAHIRRGREAVDSAYTMRSRCCAVSQCFMDAFPGRRVVTDTEHLRIGDARWSLPNSVRRFITRFDRGLPVKPITFALGWPE